MKNFQSLTKQDLKALDTLSANGWRPKLNQLPNRWHVGLQHECAGTPIMEHVDHIWRLVNPSVYRIHGEGETLREALDSALEQVRQLLSPVV
jgi:hypothetical protein